MRVERPGVGGGALVTFQTDMNQRERRRFASQLRGVADAATKAAAALEAEDDSMAMVQCMIFAISGGKLQEELLNIFKDSAEVAKAKEELDPE
jgi:hypothetical protein